MLTCVLRAHVNEPKKNNFALKNMIFWLFRSWLHDFWCEYFYNEFLNMCP